MVRECCSGVHNHVICDADISTVLQAERCTLLCWMHRQSIAGCMCKAGELQLACCCNSPYPCPSTSHLPLPSKRTWAPISCDLLLWSTSSPEFSAAISHHMPCPCPATHEVINAHDNHAVAQSTSSVLNQSVSQSINQSINQSIKQPINHSFNYTSCPWPYCLSVALTLMQMPGVPGLH